MDREEPFVVISCEEQTSKPAHKDRKDPLYESWGKLGSAKFVDPTSFAVRQLRELYPKHTVTSFLGVDILGFPGVIAQPLAPSEMIATTIFLPLARQMGRSTGLLSEFVRFGAFRVAWDKYDFILYAGRFLYGFGESTFSALIHEGSEQPSRALIHAAGIWSNDLHEEIYVFDSGFWFKDHSLWLEVQKADWKDVILKDQFKKNMMKDVFGFFDSEDLYKSLGIPWKRGVIMHGPPGNGKTISMKAIMKGCDALGYYPLYVKSFRSWKGEEGAMVDVFEKARQMAPCLVILEDLDSLINDRNRSFFLNQVDGLANNDGLLIIGTTNHLERIDPALRNRPSRFDRKFFFDDPDLEERTLYVQYWQNKLKSNKKIDFPDTLVNDIAKTTSKFSFAFLKEAFVSTLVIIAGAEDGEKDFKDVLKDQIRTLRKQLNEDPSEDSFAPVIPGAWAGAGHLRSIPGRSLPDSRLANQTRNWDTTTPSEQRGIIPGEMPVPGTPEHATVDGRRDLRAAALAAAALGRSFIF